MATTKMRSRLPLDLGPYWNAWVIIVAALLVMLAAVVLYLL